MSLLFQCFGITGVILMLYGLLAFAITQVSTWFFWTLLIGGLALLSLFIITTLSRHWQATIGSLVALNASWILLAIGKEWPIWGLGVGVGVSVAALLFLGLSRLPIVSAVAGIVVATFLGLVFIREESWFGYGVLGAAFVYNGAFLYLSRLYLRELFEKRSLRYGTNAVVYSLVVLAIIVVANVMSQDFHGQKDFTENSINTLTDQSVKIVKSLSSPVKITAFYDDRNPEKGVMKDLLEAYRVQSKNVEIRYVDPDKDKMVAEQHKAKDGDILVESGDQTNLTREVTEQGITQSIIKVTRTTTPTICFTKEHGELDIDGPDEEVRSLSAVKGGLTNEGYQPKGVEAIVGTVPPECAILVVAGPTQAFTPEEAGSIDRYLDGGGKALLLLDPNVPDPRLKIPNYGVLPTGLEELTKKWGAEIGRNFLLEKHLQIFQGMKIGLNVLAQNYGNHPVVDPLKGKQTVFQNVRSVRKAAGFSGTVVDLISSAGNDASWAESDVDTLFHAGKAVPEANDIPGPVTIAVAVEREGGKEGSPDAANTRLMVVGDADFCSNGMVRSYEFNFDLFLNSLNWLQGETDRISIRPKQIRTSAIELTPNQSNTIFYVAIIGIPMLVLIFGMDLWWYRRRRG